MFGSVEPTPFDLRFSLFGIPVRVHPFFWLVALATGWRPGNLAAVATWVACVFVSILVHELGHALTAQHFGWGPHIVLHAFGGYASYVPTWGHNTPRSVLVTAAGPGAGFVLYAAVLLVETWMFNWGYYLPEAHHNAEMVFAFLKFINLWWGLVNLLPVLPLDGGQIARDLLVHWRPYDGLSIAQKLSVLVGAALAYYFFQEGRTYAAILFAVLAFESLQPLLGGRRS